MELPALHVEQGEGKRPHEMRVPIDGPLAIGAPSLNNLFRRTLRAGGGESDAGAAEISVSLAETTEDARRMGTAAGRIGTITSLSQGRIEIGEFNVDHPEYDVAGVLLDHGTRQVNMAYAVIGSPAVIEVIATQRADPELSPEQTEVLRAIVRSLRRDVQARCG